MKPRTKFSLSFTLTLALILGTVSAIDDAARARSRAAFHRLLELSRQAGILQDQPTKTSDSGPRTSDLAASVESPSPNEQWHCALSVAGHNAPAPVGDPTWWTIQCLQLIPHAWVNYITGSSICSGDIALAVYPGSATNLLSPWPALTFAGRGLYDDGTPWSAVSNLNMSARCSFILAQPTLKCPRTNTGPVNLQVAVRCSPRPPLIIPPGDRPGGTTNRLYSRPGPLPNQLTIDLSSWLPNSTVELWENPSITNPYWIACAELHTDQAGAATTNLDAPFVMAFYIARLRP